MWSPERIDDLQVKYAGPDAGIGAEQIWTDERGTGRMKITGSQENQQVQFRIDFLNFHEMLNRLDISGDENGSTVIWTSSGELPGGPFYGYFGSLFSSGMELQYEQALQELKKVVESRQTDNSEGQTPRNSD